MTLYPRFHNPMDMASFSEGQLPMYVLCNKRYHSALHYHDFAELLLVVEGSGYEIINGQRHSMRPGTVSVLLPHHMHEFHSDNGKPIVVYCCMFDYSILLSSPYDRELGMKLLEMGSRFPFFYDLGDEQFPVIRSLMEEIIEEYRGKASGKDSMLKSKLLEALLHLLRYYEESAMDLDALAAKSNLRETNSIWNLIHYVHVHSNQPLSLQSLSNYFQLSPSYISRSFRQYAGKSFLEYLHALRINRAATLLATTDMPVSDISEEVGCEHFRSFSRRFKQLKGCTPIEYRKAHRRSKTSNEARGSILV